MEGETVGSLVSFQMFTLTPFPNLLSLNWYIDSLLSPLLYTTTITPCHPHPFSISPLLTLTPSSLINICLNTCSPTTSYY